MGTVSTTFLATGLMVSQRAELPGSLAYETQGPVVCKWLGGKGKGTMR